MTHRFVRADADPTPATAGVGGSCECVSTATHRHVLTRAAARLGALLLALQAVPGAAAHSGTTHAGTPHWVLLVFVTLGVGLVGTSILLVRRRQLSGRAGLLGLFGGFLAGSFGAIGLVEIQVVSTVGPQFEQWYPLVSLVAGALLLLGSLVAGLRYWPHRPRYTWLGIILGGWVLYPSVLPNSGLGHPVGYLLVVSLPVALGYIVREDAGGLVGHVGSDRRLVGLWAAATALVGVFLAFSAGTLSVNPDWGPSPPTSAVVTAVPVADPLVYWPAVEFVFPEIPLAGMVSVGTLLVFGTLASLVGLNVAVIAAQWLTQAPDSSSLSLTGMVSATGATACCCCAPAMYGVVSALFGAAASPVYWAFMDTGSPVGTLFLTLSIVLLLGSLVRTDLGPGTDTTASADTGVAN